MVEPKYEYMHCYCIDKFRLDPENQTELSME